MFTSFPVQLLMSGLSENGECYTNLVLGIRI